MHAARKLLAITVLAILSSCGGGGGGDGDDGDGGGLSTDACGVIGLNSRIINGTRCDEAGSPVVLVALQNQDGTSGLCSGTFITSTEILTAAHCFLISNVRAAAVVVGGASRAATEVFIHPGARIGGTAVFNDIAILRIRSAIPGTRTLPLVASRQTQDGDVFSIFGYGLDEDGNALVLRSGQMRAADVTSDHLFANFNDGSNTCNGDSGGPAVVTLPTGPGIVGITSSGAEEDCRRGDVSLFANTQNVSNLNFIRQVAPGAAIQ